MRPVKSLKNQFDLEEYIRRLEFNKTEPEVLSSLIKKAINEGKDFQKLLRAIKSNADVLKDKLFDDGVIDCLEISIEDKEKLAKSAITSIDGSRQIVGGRGKRYYIMLSVAIVELEQGIYGNFRVRYPNIELIPFEDPTGDKIEALGQDLMLLIETEALKRKIKECNSDECIMLDGPIVDPPRESSDEFKNLLKNIGYIDNRCNILKEAWKQDIKIYGFVKNIKTDNFLKNSLAMMNDDLNKYVDIYASDEELIFTILTLLHLKQKENSKKQKIFFTKPCPAPIKIPIYHRYFQNDVKIYYTYSMPYLGGKAYRLEIAAPKDANENDIKRDLLEGIKLTTTLTLPGQRIPIPIYLAHEKCKIRKGAAEIIYREILAKGISITDELNETLELVKYYMTYL